MQSYFSLEPFLRLWLPPDHTLKMPRLIVSSTFLTLQTWNSTCSQGKIQICRHITLLREDISRSGVAFLQTCLPFRYLTVDEVQDTQYFYWFAECDGCDAATAPVALWTNGGPGCSGLLGFMTEQGPFRPQADGSLAANPYAWNKVANYLFIEQVRALIVEFFGAQMPKHESMWKI